MIQKTDGVASMTFQEYSSHSFTWEKREPWKMAWGWNPDSNWGELDNISCITSQILSKVHFRMIFCFLDINTFFSLQSKILHYMRQMAVITPYAQFLFKFLSESPEYLLFLPTFSLKSVLFFSNYLFPVKRWVSLLAFTVKMWVWDLQGGQR